jgi:hypothetical protein
MLAACLLLATCLTYLLTLKMEAKQRVPPKHGLSFDGLRGVFFEKEELPMTTPVRTSNTRTIQENIRFLIFIFCFEIVIKLIDK